MDTATRSITQPAQARTRRRLRVITAAALCGCLVLGSLAVFAGYHHYTSEYQRDKALAEDGVRQLQAGESLIRSLTQSPTESTDLRHAQQDFVVASTDFSQVQHDLEGLPPFATRLPKYGPLVTGALRLAPVGLEASRLGLLGCDVIGALGALLRDPFGSQTAATASRNLSGMQQDLTQMRALLDDVTTQIDGTPSADLATVPQAAEEADALRAELPNIQQTLGTLITLASVAPAILGVGQPASYLVEQLDSTELRPGGGFIGTYGVLTLASAHVSNFFMTDVDLLDRPFEAAGHTIPYPSQYQWFPLAPSSWSLRDSNLDADFPTAARYAEQIFRIEGGTTPLQGVIAITPWLIQRALAITGPIHVPEYGVTVTAANLVDEIHFYQLGPGSGGSDTVPSPDGHSSLRKRFTSYLFEHFMDRVRALLPADLPQFFHLVANGLQTKDMQVYFNQPTAENALRQDGAASTVAAPAGDSLFVVDANIVANKANDFMTYALDDRVTISGAGTATHDTTLTYTWPITAESSQNNYGVTSFYIDYLRVYVPPGSVLSVQSGWGFQGTSQAFGREVYAGIFTMSYGGSATITLQWTTPAVARAAKQNWQYSYLVQRQPGVSWTYSVHVSLPSCARISSTDFPSAKGDQVAVPGMELTRDEALYVDYTCKG